MGGCSGLPRNVLLGQSSGRHITEHPCVGFCILIKSHNIIHLCAEITTHAPITNMASFPVLAHIPSVQVPLHTQWQRPKTNQNGVHLPSWLCQLECRFWSGSSSFENEVEGLFCPADGKHSNQESVVISLTLRVTYTCTFNTPCSGFIFASLLVGCRVC